jgi:Mn2+/Fe2+ NRAMP family transporter
MSNDKTFRDREILSAAHEKGILATLFSFFRLSGPGWLQSAITLGGGSLIGALYLGMLGGTSMLWLQLVAIVIGVIMLSAISYVTLSTHKRPYAAVNEYVNPVLGVAWITATILANMIWIMPQFSLCYDALDKNLVTADGVDFALKQTKLYVSIGIGVAALIIVAMSFNPGWVSKLFDIILKLIVAAIVVCFVAVVYWLATDGSINWNEVWMGFIPNFSHWNTPAPAIQDILTGMDGGQQTYWTKKIVAKQQESMIGVTATAVGLNMTFLLPYSMLARGWDKPFRGLAKFDLITGMAIPYLIVTTCIVIASSHAFHAKADANFLSSDPAVMQESVLFGSTTSVIEDRFVSLKTPEEVTQLNARLSAAKTALADLKSKDAKGADSSKSEFIKAREDEVKAAQTEKNQNLAEFATSLNESERRIMPTLVKPNAGQLAATLTPLLGEENQKYANLIFGIGAFGMGFSTIVILSLINGYAFAEMFGQYNNVWIRTLGALAALVVGVLWFEVWAGESRTYLGIVASTFGAILLPIAYLAFFLLMNSSKLLGREKPTGARMAVWNLLMGIGVLGATVQAVAAIQTKASSPQGAYVLGGVAVFVLLALIGFSARPQMNDDYADYPE